MIKKTITNKHILALMVSAVLFLTSSCNVTLPSTPDAQTNDKENINDILSIYHKVLSGTLSVKSNQAGDSSLTIDDIFLYKDEINVFSLYDVNNDKVPELHLSSPRIYYIIAYDQAGAYVLYGGTGYDRLLNNGAILYERLGGGPSHINYRYTWFTDGGGSFSFEKYDADSNGIYNEEDFYMIEGESVYQTEYNKRTQEYLGIGSDEPIWVLYESIQ